MRITKICSVTNCDFKHYAKKYCNYHYRELRYYGTVNESKPLKFKEHHGETKNSAYISWASMKSRCYNKNNTNYYGYGGRGIKVCDRWHIFSNFYNDMGDRPDGFTLDRIDSKSNYEPLNCRWADSTTQAVNKGLQKSNTTGYKGVRKVNYKYSIKYRSSIRYRNQEIHIGYFKTKEEAAYMYDCFILGLHDGVVFTNFVYC